MFILKEKIRLINELPGTNKVTKRLRKYLGYSLGAFNGIEILLSCTLFLLEGRWWEIGGTDGGKQKRGAKHTTKLFNFKMEWMNEEIAYSYNNLTTFLVGDFLSCKEKDYAK